MHCLVPLLVLALIIVLVIWGVVVCIEAINDAPPAPKIQKLIRAIGLILWLLAAAQCFGLLGGARIVAFP